jgi:hypothetical protein
MSARFDARGPQQAPGFAVAGVVISARIGPRNLLCCSIASRDFYGHCLLAFQSEC